MTVTEKLDGTTKFPSPCGDKCNLHKTWNVRDQTELPSPYGDKLQLETCKQYKLNPFVSVPLRG